MSPWIELVFTESKQKWPPYFDRRFYALSIIWIKYLRILKLALMIFRKNEVKLRKERSFPKRNVVQSLSISEYCHMPSRTFQEGQYIGS